MTAVQQWWGGVFAPTDIPATTFFLEDFENGLGLYTTVSGNPALWHLVESPYGATCLRMDVATGGTVNRITRPIPAIEFNRMQVKFRITSLNTDDSGILRLYNGGSEVCLIEPARETFYDAQKRIWVKVAASEGSPYAIGSTHIDVGTWYRATFSWLGGSSGVHIVIADADTGDVFIDYTRPGTFALPTATLLDLRDDPTLGSSPTEWDDIYLYTEGL